MTTDLEPPSSKADGQPFRTSSAPHPKIGLLGRNAAHGRDAGAILAACLEPKLDPQSAAVIDSITVVAAFAVNKL